MEGIVLENEGTMGEALDESGSLYDEPAFNSSRNELSTSETTRNEGQRTSGLSVFASRPFIWSANKKPLSAKYFSPNSVEDFEGIPLKFKEKHGKPISEADLAEIEMVKERMSKLLLGEDMSGSGNGVQTALAISNAVTNLSASVFGQLWRLEPLSQIRKSMWRREMECILCVTNYIVVLSPSWHTYPDGSRVEVMSSGPRNDLAANLPALRKLDSMLLEVLDCFTDTEFWYAEKGLGSPVANVEVTSSLNKGLQAQEEKWWLPIPQVPPCGLSKDTRKILQSKRDSTKQILKAVTAINNMTLADMEVPEFYSEGLPKHAKDCLGERMYRYIASHKFSAEDLLAALGISSDHQALEIANQVESAIYVFRRITNFKYIKRNINQYSSKHSWELVKDLTADAQKMALLAGRAESLLLCLKQRFPGLPQTTLDTIKIQHNKDIGKSILESYSRVLESIAFNILARIDDVLYADDMARQSDPKPELFLPKVCSVGHGIVPANSSSVPAPNTENKTKTGLAKKATLISHIPTLQTSTCGDFEI